MSEAKLVARIETTGARTAASELDKFAKAANNAENKTKGLKSALPGVGNAFKMAAGASSAIIGTLSAIAVKAAAAEDQIADLAAQSGIAVDQFKELSYAFKTVGLSQEALADTSRKVTNELGQFAQTGAGGFKAIFDALEGKVNLTADSLKNLSGPEVLQKVKNAMDEANLPIQQQGFLLDGLARGTSKLIPLLNENGEALTNATEKYNKYNDSIKITAENSKALGDVADDIDLLQTTMANAASFMVSNFAPEIKAVIDWMLQEIPEATNTMNTFFQSFRDTENITDMDALQIRLVDAQEGVDELAEKIKKFKESGGAFNFGIKNAEVDAQNVATIEKWTKTLEARQLVVNEIKAQMDEISAKKETAKIETAKTTGDFSDNDAARKQIEDQRKLSQQLLDELNSLGRSELELINIQEAEKLKELNDFNDKKLYTLAQYKEGELRILTEAESSRKELQEKIAKEILRVEDEERKKRKDAEDKFLAERGRAEEYLDYISMQGLNALELIDQQERLKLDKLREYANQGLIEYASFEEAKTSILEQSSKERAQLEIAQQQLILGSAASIFDSMAGLAETFGDKQSATYKTLFALSKGFAIAQAALGISAAAAALGDPAIGTVDRLANYAAILAAVGNITTSLSSISMPSAREQGGQFSPGQQLLVGERGPELVQFGSGGRIANNSQTNGMGGAPSITIINQTSGRIDKTEQQTTDDGRIVLIVKEVMNSEFNNPNSQTNKNINKTRNAPRRF